MILSLSKFAAHQSPGVGGDLAKQQDDICRLISHSFMESNRASMIPAYNKRIREKKGIVERLE